MPALNFEPQFETPIIVGDKPGTVRMKRKNPIKPEDRLFLFTGMRTKKCKRFMTATAHGVYDIVIDESPDSLQISGVTIVPIVRQWFAKVDGFYNFHYLNSFLKRRYKILPFKGVWIVWHLETARMVDEYLKDLR